MDYWTDFTITLSVISPFIVYCYVQDFMFYAPLGVVLWFLTRVVLFIVTCREGTFNSV
jgi:hypothetical protein